FATAEGAHGGGVDDGAMAEAAGELDRYLEADENPYELHEELRETMQRDVGIYRDEAGLTAALAWIEGVKERVRNPAGGAPKGRPFNTGWPLWIDLRNMLLVAEAIVRAALYRQESRGAHSRLDFPETSDEWIGRNVVSRLEQGRIVLEEMQVVTVDELAPLV